MKRFIFLLLFCICLLPASAEFITGEVEYNAENNSGVQADVPIKTKLYNRYIDSDFNENSAYLYKGITELKDRKLAKFSDGSYGVLYYDDPMYTWYYNGNGRLINFSRKDSQDYPCSVIKYKPDGTIVNTGYRVSENESFIYSADGKMIAHWLGENCYDSKNNLIMKRKFYN